jgi:hypothetical protein
VQNPEPRNDKPFKNGSSQVKPPKGNTSKIRKNSLEMLDLRIEASKKFSFETRKFDNPTPPKPKRAAARPCQPNPLKSRQDVGPERETRI